MLSSIGSQTSQLKPPPGMIVAGPVDVAGRGDGQALAYGGLPPRAFQRVRDYILAHLEEEITNRDLAEFAGLSAFHFARVFKQSAGVSPHQFVLERRVERVKRLLAETDLPIAQIAVAAGFADQSHCARRFRELVGITPTRFRWLSR